MKALIQRVTEARVEVEGEAVGSAGHGLLILLGAARDDGEEQARRLAEKVAHLRIFGDEEGRFNLSLLDVAGEALVVSQFTLLADVRRGRRPSFSDAAPPELAEPLIGSFAEALRRLGVRRVETGRFGAHMRVSLVNDGPVTIMLDTDELERPRRG